MSELPLRLDQACYTALDDGIVHKVLSDWLEHARVAVFRAGFENSAVNFFNEEDAGPSGPVQRFAFTAVHDPSSGGTWQLRAVLSARNQPGEFGRVNGTLELWHIHAGADGEPPSYTRGLQHPLMSTPAFDESSVPNSWATDLVNKLLAHVKLSAWEVFAEPRFEADLKRFSVALENTLTP